VGGTVTDHRYEPHRQEAGNVRGPKKFIISCFVTDSHVEVLKYCYPKYIYGQQSSNIQPNLATFINLIKGFFFLDLNVAAWKQNV
jgi:hypothetical protein